MLVKPQQVRRWKTVALEGGLVKKATINCSGLIVAVFPSPFAKQEGIFIPDGDHRCGNLSVSCR